LSRLTQLNKRCIATENSTMARALEVCDASFESQRMSWPCLINLVAAATKLANHAIVFDDSSPLAKMMVKLSRWVL